jgi:hypothetical protein
MKKDRKRMAGLLLALLTVVDLGLVAVLTLVQLSLIPARWSTQQWVFGVILPSTALVTQATGLLALWWWFNRARTGSRYRPRHSWQSRRWMVGTSAIMGEPGAVIVRMR